VGGRVTDIHWIADTRQVRVWIQIRTHERKWVWVGFYLVGMDMRTIYPRSTRPIAIPTCPHARSPSVTIHTRRAPSATFHRWKVPFLGTFTFVPAILAPLTIAPFHRRLYPRVVSHPPLPSMEGAIPGNLRVRTLHPRPAPHSHRCPLHRRTTPHRVIFLISVVRMFMFDVTDFICSYCADLGSSEAKLFIEMVLCKCLFN
jgi:hypothetical protein